MIVEAPAAAERTSAAPTASMAVRTKRMVSSFSILRRLRSDAHAALTSHSRARFGENPVMNEDELGTRLRESEEDVEQAEERLEEVEAQIEEAREHAPGGSEPESS
jgi:predicted Ser/Thr protein kinase